MIPARFSFVVLALLLAACGPAPSAPTATPPPLRTLDPASKLSGRHLQLMKIEAGAECPRAHARQISSNFGIAIGDGPAYAAGFTADGFLDIPFPAPTQSAFYGSDWSGAKVLWLVDPKYRGPVLFRGGRLDGSGQLGFETGTPPQSELWLPAAPSSAPMDWRSLPSYTRVRSAGCYMYQVDGEGFTETIIFEARAQP